MSSSLSICLYCGSSNEVDPSYLDLAKRLGETLANAGIRLVYGGGSVGLMGAAATAAHEAGGSVLGIMPRFLLSQERIFDAVEHRIVETMHERKQMMFDESDAFIVLPGGIGTLEEAVEMLSWARLDLHSKPMAFLDEDEFWKPFFELMGHIVDGKFTPMAFLDLFAHVSTPEDAIEALQVRLDND
ncbi:MAG: TIGR00730 family Rossman fold protein [Ponticaulis sp.]|nr:TIGR00730 family Rossman fold protein [Ponticaulis sp.]